MDTITFDPSAASLLSLRVSRGFRTTVYLATGLFVAGLIWSAVAKFDAAVHAPASLRPVGEIIKIQTPTGGTVVCVNADDGRPVTSGQVLFRLKRDDLESSLSQASVKLAAAIERDSNLKAESSKQQEKASLTREAQKQRVLSAEITVEERELDHRKRIVSATSAQKTCEAELRHKRLVYEQALPLAKTRAVSKEYVSRALADLNGAEAAYAKACADTEIGNDAVELAKRELQLAHETAHLAAVECEKTVLELDRNLKELDGEIKRLNKEIAHLREQIDQCVIKSPASGSLVNVRAKHIGEVVAVGDVLANLVPDNTSLEAEARVAARDIAFLQLGQRTKVRLAAFPHGQYGHLDAQVRCISRDVFLDDNQRPCYLLRCSLKRQTIRARGEEQRLRPGMAATVDILTHRQSPLSLVTGKLKNWRNVF